MNKEDYKTLTTFESQARFWSAYSKFETTAELDRRTFRLRLQDMFIFIHKNWPEICTCSQCEEDRTYIANIKPPHPLG